MVSRNRRWILFFALLVGNIFLTLALLALQSPDADQQDPLLTEYQRAVSQAEWLAPRGATNQLFPLRADNRKLEWRSVDDQQWVKVLIWQSRQAFTSQFATALKSGEPVSVGSNPVWVTLVPQVRDFCQGLPREHDPDYRLKQYLGLNPDHRYELMVELVVSPRQLFRACPDPETEDSGCNLSADPRIQPKVPGIDDYGRWYADLQRSAYRADGFPWTRQGYAYDWRYPRAGVGASEYLIAPGTPVRVIEAQETDHYCGYDGLATLTASSR